MNDEKGPKIGEILLREGLISQSQLDEALFSQKESHAFLGEVVVKKGWLTEEQLLKALSKQFSLPFISLKLDTLDWDLAMSFSTAKLVEHHCFPVKHDEEIVTVAINNPLDAWSVSAIEANIKNKNVQLVLATKTDITNAIKELKKRKLQKSKRSLDA